jgi:uncharacterized protein (TIGR03435 family)
MAAAKKGEPMKPVGTVAICCITAALFGQPASRLHFEVASIKPGGDVSSTRPERSGGRFKWTTQVCYLIGYAYGLDFSRVTGQKCGSVYSVEATFDPNTTDDQVRQMAQSLLADRFGMVGHRVTAEASGLALSIGKGGLKIKEATPEVNKVSSSPATHIFATMPEKGVMAITGKDASMTQLAQTLHRVTGIPVWDRTGLSGNYDFSFTFAQDPGTDSKTDSPSLGTALKDSIGLSVQQQKGPVESLVIDELHEPSGN